MRYAQRIQFFLRDSVLLILLVQRHQRSICIVVRLRVPGMMVVDVVSGRVRCANDFAYSFFFLSSLHHRRRASVDRLFSLFFSPLVFFLSFFLHVYMCAIMPMNR